MNQDQANLILQAIGLAGKLAHEAGKTFYTVEELEHQHVIAIMFGQINQPQVARLHSRLTFTQLHSRLDSIFSAYTGKRRTSTTKDGWRFDAIQRSPLWYEFTFRQENMTHTLRLLTNSSPAGGCDVVIGCAFDEIGDANLPHRTPWAAAKKVRDLAALLEPNLPLVPLAAPDYSLPPAPKRRKQ